MEPEYRHCRSDCSEKQLVRLLGWKPEFQVIGFGRNEGDASPEAVRELQALRTASLDLKNWLNDLEGDAEQKVRAFG